MSDQYPRRLIIDRHARNLKAIGGTTQAQEADVIVGRDRVVLKDREGQAGVKLTERELNALREDAGEVIER